jgi:hypothetical protein
MPEPQRKPDADRIRARLATLQQAEWLGTRKWWPQHVYHFAELKNLLAILESGVLGSRDDGRMVVDTASGQVLDHTEQRWKSYARFYFRPRTPTQYQVEGFRPPERYGTLGKHCPMLFILMFDSADILTRRQTEFSNGNLGAGAPEVGSNADFFDALPFERIYHEGPMPRDLVRSLTYHRCAEAIVPGRVDLSALKFICCRSDAEYHTLWHSLPAAIRTTFLKKFTIGAVPNVHFRYWTFVENVSLGARLATFRFNPSSYTPGPFHAKATFTSRTWGTRVWENAAYTTPPVLTLDLGADTVSAPYEAKLELDGNLAYRGHFKPSDDGIVVPTRR